MAVEIHPMPNHFFRRLQTITFIPDHFQTLPDQSFGQMPTKCVSSPTHSKPYINNDGQSMLLSLAIVLCLAGLLYILIYFTS